MIGKLLVFRQAPRTRSHPMVALHRCPNISRIVWYRVAHRSMFLLFLKRFCCHLGTSPHSSTCTSSSSSASRLTFSLRRLGWVWFELLAAHRSSSRPASATIETAPQSARPDLAAETASLIASAAASSRLGRGMYSVSSRLLSPLSSTAMGVASAPWLVPTAGSENAVDWSSGHGLSAEA